MKSPKLRTASKHKPPYELNQFPQKFVYNIAREIVYLLATTHEARLEGKDWEKIFASSIGAEWKPSNIGLDDVVLKNCAWGAKTVKNIRPSKAKIVRLISGRNSPVFSYGDKIDVENSIPQNVGTKILSIWNTRVEELYLKYPFLRTVVLVKSQDLCEVAVFEFNTVRYQPELYTWQWNKRGNLEGFDLDGNHKFTWQPHGSQFTIKENIPKDRTAFRVKKPDNLEKQKILDKMGFDESWISILN